MKTIKIKTSEVSMYSFEWKSFFKKLLLKAILIGGWLFLVKKANDKIIESQVISQLDTVDENVAKIKQTMLSNLKTMRNADIESIYTFKDDFAKAKQNNLDTLENNFGKPLRQAVKEKSKVYIRYLKTKDNLELVFTELQEEIDKLIVSKQDDSTAPTSRVNHALRILGLEPSDLDPDKVKAAYRKLSRQYHPDLNPGDKKAEDMFKKIGAAKEVIDKYFAEVNKKMAAFICASILRNIKYNTI